MKKFNGNNVFIVTVILSITVASEAQLNQSVPLQYLPNSQQSQSQLIRFPVQTASVFRRSADQAYAGDRIPLNVTMQLNEISSFEELDALLGFGGSFIAPRFGGVEYDERSLGRRAKPATCIPTETVVPLTPLEHDSMVILFPSCTRVKRCGGCCADRRLSCQPTSAQQITYEVRKVRYGPNNGLQDAGKDLIVVEEHTACKCDCRVKAADCQQFQRYDPSQCSCQCINGQDRVKCATLSNKYWDEDKCQCRCRIETECSTGSYFDLNTCSCKLIGNVEPITVPPNDRRRFFLKPTYITDSPDIDTYG